jgi:hypothetical protein
MSPSKKLSRGSAALRSILTLVFLLLTVWLWFNQQTFLDQIAVWQYKPTAEITQLAKRSGMNEKGTFLFYASNPEVEGTQRFNQVCDRKEEGTAVLGCYNGRKIIVYDVKDPRLDGIREVTAAHEMLHAAYGRLTDDQRQKVNALLEVEYKKLENTADYKERMAFYARTEPGERYNELHSVIGTEIRTISPELEQHYKAYFSDRGQVVGLHEAYQSVFNELDRNSKALYDELKQLSTQITAASNKYNTDVTNLNRDIQLFNNRASNGSFTTRSQFEAERTTLMTRADSLSGQRSAINSDVAAYEAKRKQYNELASESQQLSDSLNSNLAPAPEV